ncbi:MAG: hypothetical protein JNM80_05385 [Phycisphaerae bacterium]|nr:hypothetical protein [Phycisphaerae bacterium]
MTAASGSPSSGAPRRSVELLRWPPGARCRIEVEAAPLPPIDEAAAAREWDRQRAHNPRLFDAPILAAVGFGPGVVRARTCTYRRLVVQPAIPTGTEQLSVTAVVLRRDGDVPRVLLGRRGTQTRIYQSQWELGPSGGIDPPTGHGPGRAHELGWAEVCAQIRREAAEELGGADWVAPRQAWGVCRDFVARSADIVVESEWQGPELDGAHTADRVRWEYDGLAWVTRGEMAGFVRTNAVIEPSLALLGAMGWLGEEGGSGKMDTAEGQ